MIKLLLTLLLASSVAAQNCVYSWVSNPLATLSLPGSGIAPFPLGRSASGLGSFITQMRVSHLRFLNAPIRITGLAFSMDRNAEVEFGALRIKMAHTSPTLLQPLAASNALTPLQNVMDAHDYEWHCLNGYWSEIGLQTPFVYTPALGDLLVQIEAVNVVAPSLPQHYGHPYFGDIAVAEFSGATPTTISSAAGFPMMRICSDLAHLSWYGSGCPGSGGTNPGLGLTGSSVLGSTTNVVLSNALAGQFAVAALGWDAATPYPVSLASFGMPGCVQYLSPVVTAGMITNASGVAVHSIAIPVVPALGGLVVFSQFFVQDPLANQAQIVSTNAGRIQLGL